VLSRRRVLQAGALALGGGLVSALRVGAQPAITTTDLGGGLFLLQGAGCNVVAMRGSDGALMVDGGLAENAAALLDAVYAATGNDRVHTLINTHWHREHVGANELVGRAGGKIFAHETTRRYLSHRTYTWPAEQPLEPLPEIARPMETTRGEGSLEFAGRNIEYGWLPSAHTDGDLFVRFGSPDVLVAGDVVSGERWPSLDYRNGAWYGGRVRALEGLASLVAPATRVVPGHGRLITGRDVVHQRDIYDELFVTLIGYMNMGLGAEDVVARNPLAKYESEFGPAAEFLDAAFRSMQIAYVPD
jgi:glyoxylase-like metal-dependent hydrolase (beta-lactamase superfamily II)